MLDACPERFGLAHRPEPVEGPVEGLNPLLPFKATGALKIEFL